MSQSSISSRKYSRGERGSQSYALDQLPRIKVSEDLSTEYKRNPAQPEHESTSLQDVADLPRFTRGLFNSMFGGGSVLLKMVYALGSSSLRLNTKPS